MNKLIPLLALLILIPVNAYGQATAFDDCRLFTISDNFFRPIRINIIHDEIISDNIQRIRPEEGTQLSFIEPEINPQGRINSGFFTNDTGAFTIHYEINHESVKKDGRFIEIFLQSQGSTIQRQTIDYNEKTFCRTFQLTIRDPPIVLTDEEIVEQASEFTLPYLEAIADAIRINTGVTTTASDRAGLLALGSLIVVVVAILIVRQAGKEKREVIEAWQQQKQEISILNTQKIIDNNQNRAEMSIMMDRMLEPLTEYVAYTKSVMHGLVADLGFMINEFSKISKIKIPAKITETEKKIQEFFVSTENEKIEKQPIESTITKITGKIKGLVKHEAPEHTGDIGSQINNQYVDATQKMDDIEAIQYLQKEYLKLYPSGSDFQKLEESDKIRVYVLHKLLTELQTPE